MKRIVIAEDERSTRELIAACVDGLGYAPIECSDGLRALHALEDNRDVALVITDVLMPELDGRELVARLRADDRWRDLPVCVTSGKVGPKAIAELLDLGATAFLAKPIAVDELKECIHRYAPAAYAHAVS